MPSISYIADPAFEQLSPAQETDPATFARLGITFRRLFSLFESAYAAPMEYRDPLRLFRLLRMKLLHAAELFGTDAHFLMQHIFDEPMQKQVPVDLDLFSATALLLLFSAQCYGIENCIRVVFMTADRCPAICVHFRVDSEQYKESTLLKFTEAIYQRSGCYFKTCLGEPARKEAEKIPGVGHMIRNDRYATLGDHALNLFAPIKRDWTGYINRSPVFRLPENFFEGFE